MDEKQVFQIFFNRMVSCLNCSIKKTSSRLRFDHTVKVNNDESHPTHEYV